VKRALPWIAGVLILTLVLVVGLTQARGGSETEAPDARFSLDAARAKLAGSPAQLASLHKQSAQLLEGGLPAFERRLADLKGKPVVINKWASWCNPCRAEFPVFQQVATSHGKRVAFLGVNSEDSEDAAHTFLSEAPVPYPSYSDPDEDIKDGLGASFGLPDTAFYDRKGELAYLKQGPYSEGSDLRADIERCALAEECEGG